MRISIRFWCSLLLLWQHFVLLPTHLYQTSPSPFLAYAREMVIDDTDEMTGGKYAPKMFNFASFSAGAVIIDKAPASAKGYSNLLNDDKDKYNVSPCNEKRWVVVGLSEDILITSLSMANYEKYSSMLKDFQILAATTYPTTEWIDLGTYTAEPKLGEQIFNITQQGGGVHTRYMKIKFLTHYLDEALCTLSQIKVYGTTVMASLQEEVDSLSSNNIKDVLNFMNEEEKLMKKDEIQMEEDGVNKTSDEQQTIETVSNLPAASIPDIPTADTAVMKIPPSQDQQQQTEIEKDKIEMKDSVSVVDQVNHTEIVSTTEPPPNSSALMPESTADLTGSNSTSLLNSTATEAAQGQQEEEAQVAQAKHPVFNFTDSDIQTLTELQSSSVDDLTKQVNIGGVVLNVSDWKKVYAIFQESKAPKDLWSRAFRRMKGFFDPISQNFQMFLLENYVRANKEKAMVAEGSESSSISEDAEVLSDSVKPDNEPQPTAELNTSEATNPDTPITIASVEEKGLNITSEVQEVVVENQEQGVEIVQDLIQDSQQLLQEIVETIQNVTSELQEVLKSKSEQGEEDNVTIARPSEQLIAAVETEVLAVEEVVTVIGEVLSNILESNVTTLSVDVDSNNAANASCTNATESTLNSTAIVPPLPASNHMNHILHTLNHSVVSMNCFETLSFDEFEEKQLAKLQSAGKVSEDNNAFHKDHVFRQLASRIKTLEVSRVIMEMYIHQLTECMKVINKEYGQQMNAMQHQMIRLEQEQTRQRIFLESKVSISTQTVEDAASSLSSVDGDEDSTAKVMLREDGINPSLFFNVGQFPSQLKIKSRSNEGKAASRRRASTSSSPLTILRPIRKPQMSDMTEAMSLVSIVHHVAYYLYHVVDEVKQVVVAFKDSNKQFFDHHHNSQTRSAAQKFAETHTTAEVVREYILEVSIMLIIVLAVLFVLSSCILLIFLSFMWLLYHQHRAAEDEIKR